ncbi:MAG: SH3 domain-containing protein [Bacteroidia bacterium]
MAVPNPILDSLLRKEYQDLFDTCKINENRIDDVDRVVDRIIAGKARYEGVGNPLNIPWYFIGLVHNMECSLNFNLHLHNGDLLSKRTIHVPANRPVNGNPPFTWETSATDALTFDGIHLRTDWTLPALLYFMEGYNGYGYRKYHPDVKSPYLWSFSDKYTKGKYRSDGKWDSELVSEQCGSAVILKRMKDKKFIILETMEGFHVSAAPASVAVNQLPSRGKVNTNKLNIRADAGTDFEKVALPLIKGKEVEILAEKNGWYKVKTTIEGWVTKDYINT